MSPPSAYILPALPPPQYRSIIPGYFAAVGVAKIGIALIRVHLQVLRLGHPAIAYGWVWPSRYIRGIERSSMRPLYLLASASPGPVCVLCSPAARIFSGATRPGYCRRFVPLVLSASSRYSLCPVLLLPVSLHPDPDAGWLGPDRTHHPDLADLARIGVPQNPWYASGVPPSDSGLPACLYPAMFALLD